MDLDENHTAEFELALPQRISVQLCNTTIDALLGTPLAKKRCVERVDVFVKNYGIKIGMEKVIADICLIPDIQNVARQMTRLSLITSMTIWRALQQTEGRVDIGLKDFEKIKLLEEHNNTFATAVVSAVDSLCNNGVEFLDLSYLNNALVEFKKMCTMNFSNHVFMNVPRFVVMYATGEEGQDEDGNEDCNEHNFKNVSDSSEKEDATDGVPINEIDFRVDDNLDDGDFETLDLLDAKSSKKLDTLCFDIFNHGYCKHNTSAQPMHPYASPKMTPRKRLIGLYMRHKKQHPEDNDSQQSKTWTQLNCADPGKEDIQFTGSQFQDTCTTPKVNCHPCLCFESGCLLNLPDCKDRGRWHSDYDCGDPCYHRPWELLDCPGCHTQRNRDVCATGDWLWMFKKEVIFGMFDIKHSKYNLSVSMVQVLFLTRVQCQTGRWSWVAHIQ
ncbi:hypothetical protein BJ742DRAFT_872134 [Cladochytrium replicatum]|nr:hypothetical protein BJ742DRAFT_872134 [Cladochytrium replicatum]